MLYMVIVPVIPDYLRKIGAYDTHIVGGPENVTYQVDIRLIFDLSLTYRVVYSLGGSYMWFIV